jgi:protein dithiol oxidoreductase (disulfide-forming)
VDAAKFDAAYRSFGVNNMVMRSKQLQETYNVRGTPTVVVDGKYVINSLPPDGIINALNGLIEKARKDRKHK